MNATPEIVSLCDFESGQSGDAFVLLVSRERSKTRDGKPYFRVGFRGGSRTATAMIWSDTPWFHDCEQAWEVGHFYKIRCRYTETQYGPQVDLDRIREVVDSDKADGFDPLAFIERSRFEPEEQLAELCEIARTQISDEPLRRLTLKILEDNAETLKVIPAATRNHHAFAGGYIEHVLSATRTAVFFADKYTAYYPEINLSKSLVTAGAILHDIGKLRELEFQPQGGRYTAEGRLIGHILMGRDIVRETAQQIDGLDPETLLRLEHIIVAHQNLPEWGSPVAPHTPEALLVHYADDTDAKFAIFARTLSAAPDDGEEFTPSDNVMRRRLFRGLPENK